MSVYWLMAKLASSGQHWMQLPIQDRLKVSINIVHLLPLRSLQHCFHFDTNGIVGLLQVFQVRALNHIGPWIRLYLQERCCIQAWGWTLSQCSQWQMHFTPQLCCSLQSVSDSQVYIIIGTLKGCSPLHTCQDIQMILSPEEGKLRTLHVNF